MLLLLFYRVLLGAFLLASAMSLLALRTKQAETAPSFWRFLRATFVGVLAAQLVGFALLWLGDDGDPRAAWAAGRLAVALLIMFVPFAIAVCFLLKPMPAKQVFRLAALAWVILAGAYWTFHQVLRLLVP